MNPYLQKEKAGIDRLLCCFSEIYENGSRSSCLWKNLLEVAKSMANYDTLVESFSIGTREH